MFTNVVKNSLAVLLTLIGHVGVVSHANAHLGSSTGGLCETLATLEAGASTYLDLHETVRFAEVEVSRPGILLLTAVEAGGAGEAVRMRFVGRGCTPGGRVDDVAVLERSEAHLVLAVPTAGRVTLMLAKHDFGRTNNLIQLDTELIPARFVERPRSTGWHQKASHLRVTDVFVDPRSKSEEDRVDPDPSGKSEEDMVDPDPLGAPGRGVAPLLTMVAVADPLAPEKSEEDRVDPNPSVGSDFRERAMVRGALFIMPGTGSRLTNVKHLGVPSIQWLADRFVEQP